MPPVDENVQRREAANKTAACRGGSIDPFCAVAAGYRSPKSTSEDMFHMRRASCWSGVITTL